LGCAAIILDDDIVGRDRGSIGATVEPRIRARCVRAHSVTRESFPRRAADFLNSVSVRLRAFIASMARKMAVRATRNVGFFGVSFSASTTASQVTR